MTAKTGEMSKKTRISVLPLSTFVKKLLTLHIQADSHGFQFPGGRVVMECNHCRRMRRSDRVEALPVCTAVCHCRAAHCQSGIGNPLDDNILTGPLVDGSAVEEMFEALEQAKAQGREVPLGEWFRLWHRRCESRHVGRGNRRRVWRQKRNHGSLTAAARCPDHARVRGDKSPGRRPCHPAPIPGSSLVCARHAGRARV